MTVAVSIHWFIAIACRIASDTGEATGHDAPMIVQLGPEGE
jgi:hypothetical protein